MKVEAAWEVGRSQWTDTGACTVDRPRCRLPESGPPPATASALAHRPVERHHPRRGVRRAGRRGPRHVHLRQDAHRLRGRAHYNQVDLTGVGATTGDAGAANTVAVDLVPRGREAHRHREACHDHPRRHRLHRQEHRARCSATSSSFKLGPRRPGRRDDRLLGPGRREPHEGVLGCGASTATRSRTRPTPGARATRAHSRTQTTNVSGHLPRRRLRRLGASGSTSRRSMRPRLPTRPRLTHARRTAEPVHGHRELLLLELRGRTGAPADLASAGASHVRRSSSREGTRSPPVAETPSQPGAAASTRRGTRPVTPFTAC